MKSIFFFLLISFSFNAISQTVIPIENYFNYSNAETVYFKDVNNIFNKWLMISTILTNCICACTVPINSCIASFA